MNPVVIKRAAVLGSGVMGRQIAAHLAACGMPVLLFDLGATAGEASGIARKAIDELVRARPAPLLGRDLGNWITPANYDEHLGRLGACELVVEAIAERMDWKQALYQRIAPHLGAAAILVSNTSGLSVNALAATLPPALRARFCGVHFFNPVRSMRLVELIPAQSTAPALVDQLETFATRRLGKACVRAFDTPNFIANRIGTFAFVAAMHYTERFGLGFEEVDALTGPLIGRPGSATYRTLDLIGLDTIQNVLNGLPQVLGDDPWCEYFRAPVWMRGLVERGSLGQKTKGGIYRKEPAGLTVLDGSGPGYRALTGKLEPELQELLRDGLNASSLSALREHGRPQGQFLWSVLRDLWHYSAVHLHSIAHSAREVDLAMRWGYGWERGPFETWQSAGWRDVALAIDADVRAGRSMSTTPLPSWVLDGRTGVHGAEGSYSARENRALSRSVLPVYGRQLRPQPLVGEPGPAAGTTVFEHHGVRLWHLDDASDVHVVTLESRGGTLGPEVVEGMAEALARSEREAQALVIWRPDPPFSFGADLRAVAALVQAQDWATIDRILRRFQALNAAIRHAAIPVVAAACGRALGGGCELLMHSATVVAAIETQPGLVEAGVGLIPAGGGCKELAVRASRQAERTLQNEVLPFIQPLFQSVAAAATADNAFEAIRLGLLRDADVIVPNSQEVLYVALARARALAAAWQPPLPARRIQVAGRGGVATLQSSLLNLREGGMISAHDYRVGTALARALCGGDVESGTRVDEQWLLDVECHEFIELLRTPTTQQRIQHTLETGSLLRN